MDKTIVKGFRLLETLASSDTVRGVSELSREMDLTKSNVQRLLSTLVDLGYVARIGSGVTSKYVPTLKTWEIGHYALSRNELRLAAASQLRALYDEFDESVFLCAAGDDEILYIDVIEHPEPIRMYCGVGMRIPQWSTAAGRAVMAHRKPEELAAVIDLAVADQPETDRQWWQQECEKIRETGFAISEGAFRPGVNSIAAVVRSANGIVGSMAVTGPAERLSLQRLLEDSPKMLAAALRVSRALGYAG